MFMSRFIRTVYHVGQIFTPHRALLYFRQSTVDDQKGLQKFFDLKLKFLPTKRSFGNLAREIVSVPPNSVPSLRPWLDCRFLPLLQHFQKEVF